MKGLPSTTERDIIVGLAALIGGIISTIVVALPLELFLPSAVLAGIIEEPAKVIALIYIALVLPDWLTSKTKCALFGGLAGLGFAFTENLWYYLGYLALEEGVPPELIIGRTLLSLPTHALCSAIVGMGLLYVAAEGKEGYKKALGFLFIAIILHGLWNALALSPVPEWIILLLIIEMAVFGLIYYKSEDYPVPSERIGILRLLPSKREILITRNMRTFGRKDFEKDVSDDEKLLLISRNHFVITRGGNEFYIEDLNSTRGTKLNGIEIKGKGRQKLNAGSEITLPAGLKIKFTTKAKMDEVEWGKTLREKPTVEAGRIAPKSLAKLVLPNNREIEIREEERIFGREDFRGVVSDEELQFISRKHFKIMRMNDEIYIEDLDSKNGTMLNREEIKGWGRRKLEDGNEILIAKILKIRYVRGEASRR